MLGDKFIRLLALIVLCGLVYYFSYDQGRRNWQPKIERLEQTIQVKDRSLQAMAAEIHALKEDLRQAGSGAAPSSGPSAEDSERITVRLESSRIMFDRRVVLTCLSIERAAQEALLQVNMLHEDKILLEKVKLGQGLRFSLDGVDYALVLDQIQSSFVTIQLIRLN